MITFPKETVKSGKGEVPRDWIQEHIQYALRRSAVIPRWDYWEKMAHGITHEGLIIKRPKEVNLFYWSHGINTFLRIACSSISPSNKTVLCAYILMELHSWNL